MDISKEKKLYKLNILSRLKKKSVPMLMALLLTLTPRAVLSGDEIAYQSNRDGNADIYKIDVDTRVETRLTFDEAYDGWPQASPDGQTISFFSDRINGGLMMDIYLMDRDGSNLRKLSNLGYNQTAHAWSPDGSMIAYEAEVNNTGVICLKNLDTGEERVLTDTAYICISPHWSPDGKYIIYDSIRNSNWDVYMVDIETLEETRLTQHPEDDSGYNYYPGERILFKSYRDGNPEIYSMNPDGSEQTNLTNSPYQEGQAKWSPDKSMISFTSSRYPSGLWVMDPDGTNPRYITGSGIDSYSWSPGSNKIAYTNIGWIANLFVVDVETGEVEQLTEHEFYDVFPIWLNTPTGIETEEPRKPQLPKLPVLHQNYPNPFNPSTTIPYETPGGLVELHIFNTKGQLVKTFAGDETPGKHSVYWDGRDERGQELPSGFYFYKLKAGDFSQARKMVLVK
jgi:Tol biopolymer transport system component